jgi:site-specific DNA-cytosine methylase
MRGNGNGKVSPTLTKEAAGDRPSDYAPCILGPIPLDMRQASRGEKMTNNRPGGSSGGAPGSGIGEPGAQCQTYIKGGMAVRRLTPRECERLQGFPDDSTLVPVGKHKKKCAIYNDVIDGKDDTAPCNCGFKTKPAADGPRYKAIGNSWAVPVPAWIGRRLQDVDDKILAATLKPRRKAKRG